MSSDATGKANTRNLGQTFCFTVSGSSTGFSVIELLVVLAVTAIVLTIAIPNFLHYTNRDRVETAAHDFEARFRLARQKALTQRSQYRLTLNAGAGTYFYERRVGETNWVRDPQDTFSLPRDVGMQINLGGSSSNGNLIVDQQGVVAQEDVPALFLFEGKRDTMRVSIVRTGRILTTRG
jgi:prepilin-type N-terminal cleavage/methylation domain-containing protein